ncbi:sigma-70 family RNA polymerase sigma factor [Paludisphaera mucosa]|uniref:Sigma-70 family RNA polymerase sigma factor n=1 Tax=Paludisphaera mucosa TaxID=3030827 RepID=A0ABT6FE08_9BACT|nr:sigma-70 family RNA polymerase sigma factor [Paludisphaera mucosa]MDG3005808.1 sigma-70 family RNA polymerase sigma factor [Paludisphaera mucosa]
MISAERFHNDDLSGLVLLERADVRVLTPEEERRILMELDAHRRVLAAGAEDRRLPDAAPDFDVQDFVRTLLAAGPATSDEEAVLLATAKCYNATRTRLAMANLRLVAHVARRYRDRGLSASDLLQEGFCGLLTAIDRYDVSNTTRLASYAVWWIRQSLQRAVAAGVYPVRLNPRHLQKLAESSHEAEDPNRKPARPRSSSSEATLKQIHTATRPALSLDAPIGDAGGSSLMDTLSYPSSDEADDPDQGEQLASLIDQLKPRERMVLQLRFGLNGQESRSLSQVSQVLDVSKERIRQIQDAALAKLRALARRDRSCCEVG